jgi:hypothetical protein
MGLSIRTNRWRILAATQPKTATPSGRWRGRQPKACGRSAAVGWCCFDLLADLATDLVFLLVQRALFLLGDVPTVLRGHVALFLANLAVFLVQLARLALGDFAFLHFVVDTLVLVGEAVTARILAMRFMVSSSGGRLTDSAAVPSITARFGSGLTAIV